MPKLPLITCFGEILWDVFPDGSHLGGAPLNVALRLHSLGSQVVMIGAVGADQLGQRALETIKERGLNTAGITKNTKYPTGTVAVQLTHGIASYEIAANAAWDHIQLNSRLREQAKASDALLFGSLALRREHNREILRELLDPSVLTVFDVNLRDPHYELSEVAHWMGQSDMVKMNDEELEQIAVYSGVQKQDLPVQAQLLQQHFGLQAICVTLGEKGAFMWMEDRFFSHKGYPSSALDTVGAGDAFLATLIHHLLMGDDPSQALKMACAMGALVAGKEGANCIVTPLELARMIDPQEISN